MDPRIQGPTRASVDHGLPELQLLLDNFVSLCPETQLFRGVFGAECPVHIELQRYLVGPIEDMRGRVCQASEEYLEFPAANAALS